MDAWPPRIAFPISHFVKIQSQQARGLVQTREAWHFLILFSLNWSSPCVACALCGRARYSVTQWGVIAFMVLCTNKWLIATATFCTHFSFEISVTLACGWICHSIEHRRHTWDSFTLQPWLYSSAETLLERFLLLKWITRHCFFVSFEVSKFQALLFYGRHLCQIVRAWGLKSFTVIGIYYTNFFLLNETPPSYLRQRASCSYPCIFVSLLY